MHLVIVTAVVIAVAASAAMVPAASAQSWIDRSIRSQKPKADCPDKKKAERAKAPVKSSKRAAH